MSSQEQSALAAGVDPLIVDRVREICALAGLPWSEAGDDPGGTWSRARTREAGARLHLAGTPRSVCKSWTRTLRPNADRSGRSTALSAR